MTSRAGCRYDQASPRTRKRRPCGTISRSGSACTTPSICTRSESTRAWHSRRVPKPCEKRIWASFTHSACQVEHDDLVLRRGPGPTDDAFVVEFADDGAAGRV